MEKVRLGILFGGKSAEHEVSLLSAKSIIEAIDQNKYDVVLIGIDKQGRWQLQDSSRYLKDETHVDNVQLHTGEQSSVVPYSNDGLAAPYKLDVVFPVLHGSNGEDGTVQGLLKLANIPFIGAGVLGSAVGMDKDVMKRLLRDAAIPIAPFRTLDRYRDQIDPDALIREFGLPLFIKPANLGSSIGITKVKTQKELLPAIEYAFRYDRKVLIEKYIRGQEVQCAVIGNDHPIASLPCEIIPNDEFHSFTAKYTEGGEILKIPADLPPETMSRIQHLCIRAYHALCCEGLARIDCFLDESGNVIVNEINTIPGFTPFSPFPKMWEASGVSLPELIDRLVGYALERHERENKLQTHYTRL